MKQYLMFIFSAMLVVALLTVCIRTFGNINAVLTRQTESFFIPSSTNTNAPSAVESTVNLATNISLEGLMAIYKELNF